MNRKILVGVGILLLALWTNMAHAAELGTRLVVTLPEALIKLRQTGEIRSRQAEAIRIYLTRENGRWVRTWGYANRFNANVHEGEITAERAVGDAIELDLAMTIEPDNWVRGGQAKWTLRLATKGDTITGAYSGTYTTGEEVHTVKDVALNGFALPPNPVRADFKPLDVDEHPRLLFREHDLPAIKARLKTPLGQAVLKRLENSSDPIALGMMYQLTGDKKYADRAFPEASKVMANRDQGPFAIGREWGYKTRIVGLAYDLCYDAWTEEQREQTENYLDEILDLCLNRKHRVGTVNWAPGSNYTMVIHAGNGLAAMAMMGKKTEAPAKPPALREAAAKLTPPAAFKPGKDVPVVALPVEQTITEWLMVGPFALHYLSPIDPLAANGGVADIRPGSDTEVKFRSGVQRWRVMNRTTNPENFGTPASGPKMYGVPKGQVALSLADIAKREQTRVFLYTVVNVDISGWYQFKTHAWNNQAFLDGQRIADGEHVHLAAGQYPFMFPLVIGAPSGNARPMFLPSTEEAAIAFYADAKRKESHAAAMAQWQRATESWQQGGGVNRTWLKYVRQLEYWNILNLEMGMMEGGFQGEGESYTLECHEPAHDYALAFRNVFGRELTGRNDISHFAPRYIVTTAVWQDNGPRAMNQSYGRGEETIPTRYLPRSIALAPKAWQPAVLWFWQQRVGMTHEQFLSLDGQTQMIVGKHPVDALTAIQTLIHLPLDVQPQNPGDVMPRAYEASGRGFYAFRNQWAGKNDIIAQIYGRTGQPCGWNQPESGSFQIWAFGHEMAYKNNDGLGKTGTRWYDNVVMLPDDPIKAGALSTLIGRKLDAKTGAGVVTFDMSPIYMGNEEYTDDKGVKKVRDIDLNIRGLRSFAADFSGKSGAPGLFAVVDKITGGKTKQWVYQLPVTERDKNYKLDIDDRGFTLAWSEGSLRATVVSPAKPVITRNTQVLKAHPLSTPDVKANALLITGPEKTEGDFFVIFTVQQKAAPAVTISGSGLDAKVTIGQQVVGFDGTYIVTQP